MSGALPPSAEQILALTNAAPPVVSLYVSLMPGERDLRAPEARVRQMLGDAEQQLAAEGTTEQVQSALLAPIRALQESNFAEHRDPGLALLIASNFTARVTLPEPPAEDRVVVAPHVHIKPLLPLLAHNRRFHILALSSERVRLLTATPFTWNEQPLIDLPPEIQAELDSRPASDSESIEQARMSLLVQDPHRVTHAIRAALGDDPAPIVLAAEPHVTGHFTKAAKLPRLLGQTIAVNPFALSEAELHARALEVMTPLLDTEADAVLEQAVARLGTAENTVAIRLEEILAAGNEGRIDSVIVAADDALWGRFEPAQTLMAHGHPVPGDEDLLNVAAVLALRNGGRAFSLPRERLPRSVPAVATLRF